MDVKSLSPGTFPSRVNVENESRLDEFSYVIVNR